MDNLIVFNDEQLRVAANLRQYYDAWRSAKRDAAQLTGYMAWKTVKGRQYLYRLTDTKGNGTSLGPRTAETEARFAAFTRSREQIASRVKGASEQLEITGALYRSLHLGAIASPAAAILREADVRGMLGRDLLVVGTSALAAYEIEASCRFAIGMDATEDFDLTWAAARDESVALLTDQRAPVLAMLKAVDDSYVVNTERPFKARNRTAFAVEILLAPSVADGYPRTEPLRPVPLPEQDWLLAGRRVDQVVCGRDGTAARVVAPDPRWFALQKCWLSHKPGRDPLKVRKDWRQGLALLEVIRAGRLPQHPLDAAFIAGLPDDLQRYATEAFRRA